MQLSPDLSTTLFLRLYENYQDQHRISALKRWATAPTQDEFLREILPAGLPLIYSTPTLKALQWDEAVEILRALAVDAVVEVRQASFDSPGEYISARRKERVSLSQYLNELHLLNTEDRQARYAGNVSLDPSLADSFGASRPDCLGWLSPPLLHSG